MRLVLWGVVALAAVSGLSACSGETKGVSATGATQPKLRIVWRARVGQRAAALANGAGGVWVASAAPPGVKDGRLFRLDPRTGRRTASVPVGWWPSGVAVGLGGAWVADSIGDGSRLKNNLPGLQNALTRIDLRGNRVIATIAVPGIDSVAVGYNAVWATALVGGAETLRRLDPRTNRVVAELKLPGASGPLALGGGRVWALTWFAEPAQHARISEIDPRSNRVVGSITVPQAGPLSDLVYSGGVLWVSMVNPNPQGSLRGRVVRIDLRRRSQVGRAQLVPGATALAGNTSGVWVAGNRSLLLLDSKSGRTIGRLTLPGDVPEFAQALAAGPRAVWVIAGARLIAIAS